MWSPAEQLELCCHVRMLGFSRLPEAKRRSRVVQVGTQGNLRDSVETRSKLGARAPRRGLGWVGAGLPAAALLGSCSSSSVTAQLASTGPAHAPPPLTARPDYYGWMLAPDDVSAADVRTSPDGRRSFILRGVRWVDHPDGSVERARQVFQEEDVKAALLPPHLGGGFLFHVTVGSGTHFWRTDTWTGDLRPLGRVDPPVSEISMGFDRLYLANATSHTLRAMDAFSGKAMDLSPLPAAAAYGDMVFVDPWNASVLAGVRGALVSFDAGESWHPLSAPAAVTELGVSASGAITLGTDAGRFELDPAGRLVQTGARGSDALFGGADTFARYGQDAFPTPSGAPAPAAPPLGGRPLRAAVLRGWPDTPSTAVVIEQGVLGRVDLKSGKLLSASPHAGVGPCRGVALGTGFGFVCGDAHGPIEVYAYHDDRLELELSLDGPHAVRSSGNGALVIDAPCHALHRGAGRDERRPTRSDAQRASTAGGALAPYCARQVSGELMDVRVRGDIGTERVAALRDGRVAVLIPPRASAPGRLSIISKSGATSSELELAPEAGPGARLVRSGLWLDELWQVGEGQLGAWVVGAQAFVGVVLDLDGVVRIARLQEGLDETFFYGPYAVQVAASANLRETHDYGAEWRVSALPPALLTNSTSTRRPLRGCSAVGCMYDDWLRIGFSASEVAEPPRPQTPARVAYEAPGFAFWTLSCDPVQSTSSGDYSRASTAQRGNGSNREPARSGRARLPGEPPESSAWLSFQSEPPPAKRSGDVGYDFGETSENGAYRAYVWGPNVSDWSRRGMWQVRVGDRFSTADPWSTVSTRSPWSGSGEAAQAFGLDANTGVDWWLRPGATGQSAVLQVRVKSESSIHLIDRERAIVTLESGVVSDLGAVSGAYEVNDTWYLGAARAEQFQLYRIVQNKPELVATYPLWGRVVTQLVQSVHGDELALWQKSAGSGWYVYPIDLETFAARPALHVPSERLGTVPPACEPGRPGWLMVSGVPLTDNAVSESNTHFDFSGAAEGLRTRRLAARVVVDESGVCVQALAALTDGPAPGELRVENQSARRALPLTVTDPTDGRRWGFRCSPP